MGADRCPNIDIGPARIGWFVVVAGGFSERIEATRLGVDEASEPDIPKRNRNTADAGSHA